ncbi:unnamed protein product, partial [Sphagnum compactum]
MCMGSIFSVTEFPPPSSAFSHFCQKAYLSSPVHPVTNVGPLVVVLTLSLMKQAFEDWRLFLSDNVINSSLVAALHYGDWVEIPRSKLMVGDIVKVQEDQYFPADLLFLTSPDTDGVCYVETSSLDGETNLTSQKAPEQTWDYVDNDRLARLKGMIDCEHPNNSLYTFTGNLKVGMQAIPIPPNQILLQGCSLWNTESAVGVVVFTGHETKVTVLTFFTLLTLYSNIIPISLYVSIEMIEFIQSTQFINNDLNMYDNESDTPVLARTSNYEELGQHQEVPVSNLPSSQWKAGLVLQGKVFLFRLTARPLVFTGADRVIYDRIADGEENKLKDITWDHLEKFGVDGLRTLCLADRDLDPQLYETWNELYNQAKSALRDQKEKIDAVRDFPLCGELTEKDLILLGCTAIEDKLQEGVPTCIDTLAKAGIKIWVLTACSLLNNEMKQFIISSEVKAIRDVAERGDPLETAQVIEDSVTRQLQDCLREANQWEGEIDMALVIDGRCLMCALDPDKLRGYQFDAKKITLSIGDGANDVSMIQAAHIGVGINGQEGYSGQRFYDDWFQSLYNVVFTALPVFAVGIFDKVIWVWLSFALYQSLIFFIVPVAAGMSAQNSSSIMLGVWDIGTLAYTCIIITVNLCLLMASGYITIWHQLSVGGSIVGWFLFLYIYSCVQSSWRQGGTFWVLRNLMRTWYFWFTIIFIPVVALSGDFFILV